MTRLIGINLFHFLVSPALNGQYVWEFLFYVQEQINKHFIFDILPQIFQELLLSFNIASKKHCNCQKIDLISKPIIRFLLLQKLYYQINNVNFHQYILVFSDLAFEFHPATLEIPFCRGACFSHKLSLDEFSEEF